MIWTEFAVLVGNLLNILAAVGTQEAIKPSDTVDPSGPSLWYWWATLNSNHSRRQNLQAQNQLVKFGERMKHRKKRRAAAQR
jgi:hypothetical protein